MKGNWQYNQHRFVLLLPAKKPKRERTNALNNPPKHYDCPPQTHQAISADAHVAFSCEETEILLAKCHHSETFPMPDINY